jgi:hypothetical protein
MNLKKTSKARIFETKKPPKRNEKNWYEMRGIKLSKIFVLGSKNDWAAAKKKMTFTLFISNGITFFRFKNAFFG